MKIDGTTLLCPCCGDGIELTITLGPSKKVGDYIEVSVGFDEADLRQRFEAHVMTAPENHPTFAIANGEVV